MLSDLMPRQKLLVFDLVEEAGLDMTDWVRSSNDSRGPKANPKYCYDWSYVEAGKLIILNLWHPNMVEEEGRIVQRANFRADAEFHRNVSRKPAWERRARQLDKAIQIALQENLPVRVIICDGTVRQKEVIDSDPSSVSFRELDPEPWTITAYDWNTGAHEVTRGILAARYVDQFDIRQADKIALRRRYVSGSVVVRDPAVRRLVLERADGRCELCGEAGFRMASRSLYLETHHVVRLADGGDDDDRNVVALCANDHRRAHFADQRGSIAKRLLEIATGSDKIPLRVAANS